MGFIDELKRLFTAADPPDHRSDKRALLIEVRRLASIVDGYIEQVPHPGALMERPEFMRAVEILGDPVFENRELLELGTQPPEAIWQMGVVAAGNRPTDNSLVDPLLVLFEDGFAWQKFFVINALVTHTPFEISLAGALLYRMRRIQGGELHFLLQMMAPILAARMKSGEKPTFGPVLDDLDGSKADQLEGLLKQAVETPVAEPARILLEELGAWRTTFTDRTVLEEIGRIHRDGRGIRPCVLTHPVLDSAVREAVRALTQEPPRTVLVTGEHGVGKSAVVQRVADELARRGWIVFEASGADLIAGQSFIGEFEARIRDLVAQIGGGRRVLWYVPDFHTLAWVGRHSQSNTGALDLIYPHLESGNIFVIGELTAGAYQKLVQDMPRLLTACEVCPVPALEEGETLALAARWAEAVAATDQEPLIDSGVLEEAWLLARQYLRDREAPGCLLDFLDQARRALLAGGTVPVRITRDTLIDTLTAMTGLPRGILDDRESLDPAGLKEYFDRRILGQPEAVACLVERITLIKAGLTDPTRPPGVFLFAGPTGTGKTEIAKALATFLFGSEERLLRYDMSEFQTPDSLERLVGDGKDLDRESLALKIRKQPFAVVLLDEFEKAHAKVWDLFLQVFDDGRLTDPLGRTSDFRHAIIILTSNLGGQSATGVGLGFDQDDRRFRSDEVDRAVARTFRPEFVNRLDRVVVFRPFSRETMRALLEKELHDVQDRRGLRNRNWAVVWEDSALELLLDRGFSPTLGARPLKRAVERYLLTPLADLIVRGRVPAGDQFLYIQARDGGLVVDFIDPDAADEPAETAEDAPPRPSRSGGRTAVLAGIALNPAGTPAELESLEGAWEEMKGHVDSPVWTGAKDLALSMTAVPDFWSSPERHAVLGEVEYRERVETGLDTVGDLLRRISSLREKSRERYPRRLLGQAADRLRLLDRARRALADRSVWEAFLTIEDKTSAAGRGDGLPDWPGRLRDMYLAWGKNRKMRVQVLTDAPARPGQSRRLVLAMSGYAAYDILVPETGLHVWEQPDPARENATRQSQALVRVLPQPEDRVAETDEELLALARETDREPAAGPPSVVRIYRDQPTPLVKDRILGWRSGRLDRVLGGDFDLYGDSAGEGAARGAG